MTRPKNENSDGHNDAAGVETSRHSDDRAVYAGEYKQGDTTYTIAVYLSIEKPEVRQDQRLNQAKVDRRVLAWIRKSREGSPQEPGSESQDAS